MERANGRDYLEHARTWLEGVQNALNQGARKKVFFLIWLVIDARDIAPGDDVHRRENGLATCSGLFQDMS
jgi:hypothetical protein